MQANIKRHLWYYLSLCCVFIVTLSMTYVLSYDKTLQLLALFAATCFYILWGIVHQHIHHHLTPKIMLEYILMGSLGFVITVLLFQV